MTKLLFLCTTACAMSFSLGCVIDSTDSPPRVQQTGSTPGPDPVPPPDPAPDAGEVTPLVVELDADRTMTAQGGEGVGVFVEYASGGKWHLFWTCDTAITGQACEFLLRATAKDGTLTVPDKGVDPAESFEFESLTKTEVNEVFFTAKAGSDVQIEAVIGGEHSSKFFFFVQNGAVNGDYTGILTDPLIFRPKGGK
jgi:hypothetical protein